MPKFTAAAVPPVSRNFKNCRETKADVAFMTKRACKNFSTTKPYYITVIVSQNRKAVVHIKSHIFKFILQVCSRLAYECLTAIKRGISSPRFVESDPHFGLLTRTVQYLEREMRGNYRNLVNRSRF